MNEGAIEWPPSPFRIMRALLASGYGRVWNGQPPTEARRMVDALTEKLPTFFIPTGLGSGHTRHYMPPFKGNTDRVLDVFAAFPETMRWPPGAGLVAEWDLALPEAERELVSRLVSVMPYLGRAEGWIDASLIEELPAGLVPCSPADSAPDGEYERVRLLALMPAAEYSRWKTHHESTATSERRTARRGGGRAQTPVPDDLIAALQADTADLQDAGWTQPPGTRWVTYWRPVRALSVERGTAAARPRRAPIQDTALYSITSDTRRGEALPRVEDTLPRAELLHRTLVRESGRAAENALPAPSLAGRYVDGRPLKGHGHAYLSFLDSDGDGRLDHVLVHAGMGFEAAALEAIRNVRRTWAKGLPEIFLTLVGLGRRSDFAHRITSLGRSRKWVSVTPFVPPRHLKARGRNTLGGQVMEELQRRGFPVPATIEVELEGGKHAPVEAFEAMWHGAPPQVALTSPAPRARGAVRRLATRWRHFRLERAVDAKRPPVVVGVGLRIHFSELVEGPICIGYASHFGLGGFAPAGT